MQFTKMQGAGNDYVYIDTFSEKVDDPAGLAPRIADRHFGVGGDGLILISPSTRADARMIMYNADGSRAEMCGNGVRCVAKYVYDHGISRKPVLQIETDRGILEIKLLLNQGRVSAATVNMGIPEVKPEMIPVLIPGPSVLEYPVEVKNRAFRITCVNLGNPHCVIFLEEPVDQFPVGSYGPVLETSPIFPQRANVEFVQVISRNEVQQRTWERGSGETLACGTGASAVCVAGVLTGRITSPVTVHLPGGDLLLEWEQGKPVFMTGPAEEVFTGIWP
jgi:diaminopimelate epimerase